MLVVTPLSVVALEKLQLVLIHTHIDLVAAPHLEYHSEECTKTAQFIPVHSIQCTHYTHVHAFTHYTHTHPPTCPPPHTHLLLLFTPCPLRTLGRIGRKVAVLGLVDDLHVCISVPVLASLVSQLGLSSAR